MATIAEQLANYFCGESFRTIRGPVFDRMKTYALDTLAVGLAGSTAQSSLLMRKALMPQTNGTSIVFGTGYASSPGEAALLNASASHALELDDDHRISVLHPGAVVVPSAFALAEVHGASGRDFLRAVLAGYEVAIRTGEVFQGRLFKHGLHPTAVCGVFGAAAAGAVILGLDTVGFVRALGLAGTQAAGLTEWRTDGSWMKRLNPGHSAQSGVIAALLAQQGFTAPSTIFEGVSGFLAAFSNGERADTAAWTRGLGEDFRAVGTAVKPYPCCRFLHGTIDTAIAARAEKIEAPIQNIVVRIYRTDTLTYHHQPLNAVDAQFNIPYVTAVALLKGSMGIKDFTPEAILRAPVLALARRVAVIEDDEFSAAYPEQYLTSLEIEFSDGSKRAWRSECPSGDPEASIYRDAPGAFDRDAVQKTKSLFAECGFGKRSSEFIQLVNALPDSADVYQLADTLKRPPQA